MIKKLMLFLVIGLFFLVSCSSDNEEVKPYEDTIYITVERHSKECNYLNVWIDNDKHSYKLDGERDKFEFKHNGFLSLEAFGTVEEYRYKSIEECNDCYMTIQIGEKYFSSFGYFLYEYY